MLRLSKLTDYGTVVLTHLADQDGHLASAGQIAARTRIAVPTVSKLLKALSRAGLVKSERGALGGYALARGAEQITAAEIIDALEGPVAITECAAADSHCDFESFCRVGSAWQTINARIRDALNEITLADLQLGGGALPAQNLNPRADSARHQPGL